MDYEQKPVIETVALLPLIEFNDKGMGQEAEDILIRLYSEIGGQVFDFETMDEEIDISRFEDQMAKRALSYILNTIAKAESMDTKTSEALREAADRIAALDNDKQQE